MRTGRVVMGSIGYKHEAMAGNDELTQAALTKINLKLISGVEGHAEICQLVAINLTDVVVKGLWIGPGRLRLMGHVNASLAGFAGTRVVGAQHFVAELETASWLVVYDDNRPILRKAAE